MKDCIDYLTIEATRRCNIRCVHCMRGNPQPFNMTRETLRNAVQQFDLIGEILVTGGEPSLYPEIFDYIRELKEEGNAIDMVSFVTNGVYLVNNVKFIKSAEGLAKKCTVIASVSQSEYHEGSQNHAEIDEFIKKEKMKGVRLGWKFKTNSKDLRNVGRAYEFGIGVHDAFELPFNLQVQENGSYYIKRPVIDAANVYVNVFGQVINGVEWDYESQKQHKCGSVLQNIAKALVEHNRITTYSQLIMSTLTNLGATYHLNL